MLGYDITRWERFQDVDAISKGAITHSAAKDQRIRQLRRLVSIGTSTGTITAPHPDQLLPVLRRAASVPPSAFFSLPSSRKAVADHLIYRPLT
ncbi:hypothetical protein [Bradyrhizobium sp. USDA 223]|uniref:hypothetical protein n=1 Tax=Bradyrhizobium sp. USDA 223 TaxID=3156306 RepID=UPI00383709F9